MNEVQKHVVNKNESDISISETESSDSKETERSNSDSENNFTSEWSKDLKMFLLTILLRKQGLP